MEYKVKKKHGKGQNEFDTVIEMTGLTHSVTISSLLGHLEKTQKVAKEQHSQKQVNDLLIRSAIKSFPLLGKIPQDKIGIAFSCLGKMVANKEIDKMLKECDETIKIYSDHLKNIEEATGIKCTQDRNPFEKVNLDETGTPELGDPSGDEIETK